MTAGIVGLMVDATYLGIIVGQHEADGRVALFAVYLFAVSMLSLFAAFTPTSPPARLVLLGAATGGFLTAGVAGIFSIGLPLLGAGVACGIEWARFGQQEHPVPADTPLLSALAGIGTGTLLVLGIALS
jgi:hypothetical protein